MLDYDVIIVGCGPAGMNAALYTSRLNLKTLIIEKECPGSKLSRINKIENYLGKPNIEGYTLALDMFKQSISFGASYKQGEVLEIKDYINYKEVILKDYKYKCYGVILCLGIGERKLHIEGEDKYFGKGVSYCILCDAPLYKNKKIVVIGKGTEELKTAEELKKYSEDVTFLCIENNSIKSDKVNAFNNCKIVSLNGDKNLSKIVYTCNEELMEKDVDVVFPLLGNIPNTYLLNKLNITNEKGFIIVDESKETLIKGIFSAGDCNYNSLKQITIASSEGAIAAININKYINKLRK